MSLLRLFSGLPSKWVTSSETFTVGLATGYQFIPAEYSFADPKSPSTNDQRKLKSKVCGIKNLPPSTYKPCRKTSVVGSGPLAVKSMIHCKKTSAVALQPRCLHARSTP